MRIVLLSILIVLLLSAPTPEQPQHISPTAASIEEVAVPVAPVDLREYKFQALQERVARMNPAVPPETARSIAREVICASEKYGLPPELIVAVIETESAYDVRVVNAYGAYGLMQVVYRYWYEELPTPDPELLRTVHHNVDVGSRILRQYHDRFGSRQYLVKYGGWRDREHGARYLGNIERRSRQVRAHMEAVLDGADAKDITGVWHACVRAP